jgi:hypothetical protein
MSHAGSWRAACRTTIHFSVVSFRSSFGRTRRDRSQRWLWRLVRQGWNMDDRIEEKRDTRGRLGDRMLGTNRPWECANTILHVTRYDTLPGMADTLDLELTSRRESCSEPPYSTTDATLPHQGSTWPKTTPGRMTSDGLHFGRTSKMSHDDSRRGACSTTITSRWFHFGRP